MVISKGNDILILLSINFFTNLHVLLKYVLQNS